MTTPVIAHVEAIHITTASDTALSNANKLEEGTSFDLEITNTVSDRQVLNGDGWVKKVVTGHSGSGSIEYLVDNASPMHAAIGAAAVDGSSLFFHVITNSAASTGQKKGTRYEVICESHGQTWTTGELKGATVSVGLTGAPVDIIAS